MVATNLPEISQFIDRTDEVPAPRPAHNEPMVLSVEQLLEAQKLIEDVMEHIMKKGHHYGTIEGTQRPSLWQPGGEVLCRTFRLAPKFPPELIVMHADGNHRYFRVTCTLTHIITGQQWGWGLGSCGTQEKKYAYLKSGRSCPECDQTTIFESKKKDEPGYFCWRKKGGCGAKFAPDDRRITDQPAGRVVNPDLPDLWNTVLKMAAKRAFLSAVKTVTAVSDVFTVDVDEDKETASGKGGDDRDISDLPEVKTASLDQRYKMMELAEKLGYGPEKMQALIKKHGAKTSAELTAAAAEGILLMLQWELENRPKAKGNGNGKAAAPAPTPTPTPTPTPAPEPNAADLERQDEIAAIRAVITQAVTDEALTGVIERIDRNAIWLGTMAAVLKKEAIERSKAIKPKRAPKRQPGEEG